jgi:hypothetical protein
MQSLVVVFYLKDWNKGINERSELLPAAPRSPSKLRRAFYFIKDCLLNKNYLS